MKARPLSPGSSTRETLPSRPWLIGAIVLVSLIFMLAVLDRWTYNNDPIHALDFGYNIGGEDPDIRSLYEASVENCKANAAADQAEYCAKYQKVILTNLFPNYPIPNLFGYLLQYRYGSGSFLTQVGHAVVIMTCVGALLALLLGVIPLGKIERPELLAMTLVLLVGGLLQRIGGKLTLELAQPVVDETTTGTSALAGIVILLVCAAAGAIILRRFLVTERVPGDLLFRHAGDTPASPHPLWLLLGLPGLLLVGRAVGIHREIFQIAAAATFAWFYIAAAVQARLPALPAAAIGLLLFGMVNGDSGIILQASKMQGFFVTGMVLAYATLRPRGKLVWLLPTTWLFHISSAGLCAFVIFVAEAMICLRRRRLSHLFGATLVTAAPAMLFGLFRTSDPLISLNVAALQGLFGQLMSSPALTLGAGAAILLLLSLAAALLLGTDEEWDGVARFALLLVAVAMAALIHTSVGQDRAYDPGYYLFVTAHDYFSPAVDLGGTLGLTGLLVARAFDRERAGGAPMRLGRPDLRWLLPVMAALCVVIAKGPPVSVSKGVVAVLNGPGMAFLGEMPVGWSSLAPAAGDNDDYYLNELEPKNGPILYVSLLKMKVRKALGQFDSKAMRIYALNRGTRKLVAGQP